MESGHFLFSEDLAKRITSRSAEIGGWVFLAIALAAAVVGDCILPKQMAGHVADAVAIFFALLAGYVIIPTEVARGDLAKRRAAAFMAARATEEVAHEGELALERA